IFELFTDNDIDSSTVVSYLDRIIKLTNLEHLNIYNAIPNNGYLFNELLLQLLTSRRTPIIKSLQFTSFSSPFDDELLFIRMRKNIKKITLCECKPLTIDCVHLFADMFPNVESLSTRIDLLEIGSVLSILLNKMKKLSSITLELSRIRNGNNFSDLDENIVLHWLKFHISNRSYTAKFTEDGLLRIWM
ncbi:unnamed protein product, partial [Didymodactylos carnosus]